VQIPVFVHSTNLIQEPRGMEFQLIPSVIWLQLLDDCQYTSRNAPKPPLSIISKSLWRFGNQELCTARDPVLVGENRGVDGVIEGRAQVIGGVTDDLREIIGRLIKNSSAKDLLFSLLIEFAGIEYGSFERKSAILPCRCWMCLLALSIFRHAFGICTTATIALAGAARQPSPPTYRARVDQQRSKRNPSVQRPSPASCRRVTCASCRSCRTLWNP
jgi:hypothetical protein